MSEGDVGAIIQHLEFDGVECMWPAIVHISGNVYAIVYHGPGDDGWIKTVTITDAGAMALVSGGLLEFEENYCYEPDVIHVGGEVYAIVYRGPVDDGWIKTVTINSAGAMALVSGGSLEFDTDRTYKPRIIHVAGMVYVIAHTSPWDVGKLTTITITDAGAMALVSSGTLDFDAACGIEPDIIHVVGDVYAIVYRGPDDDGWIKTVTINSAGAMALVSGGSLEFDTDTGKLPTIIHVADDVYAVVYVGPGDDGWIKTVTISAAGVLALVGGGLLEFDAARGQEPDIIHVSGSVYAITYQNNDSKIWTKTVTITDAGAISFADSTGAEQTPAIKNQPDVIHVAGDVYAVAWKNSVEDGYVTSFNIETIITATIRHEMMMGIG